MKSKHYPLCILVLFFMTALSPVFASQLFIYISPTGEKVVTDRPINLDGYELDSNKISASRAGLSLRGGIDENLIEKHIRNAAYLYDLDAALIRAVIKQESAFKVDAKSKKGAMGLMQLMPATAKQYRVTNILDPKQNIYAGTQHLGYLMQKYRNLSLALAAYNAGETAVARYNGIPPYRETQNYVRKILADYKQHQSN